MNCLLVFSLIAALLAGVEAQFLLNGLGLGTALGGSGALTGAGLALGAGAAIAGGFALGALAGRAARAGRRGRRFRRNVDSVFSPDSQGVLLLEPIFQELTRLDEMDCAKQYLCDLAAREPESWDDKETILVSLFADQKGIPLDSAKSEYDLALRLGFLGRDAALCRKRYAKCTDQDIQ